MDLFEYSSNQTLAKKAPLSTRMRPKTLDEFIGQQNIVGKDKLLYRAIKADKLSSLIFYGPPGTGKTTLAKIISNNTKSNFIQINATTSGVKDIKESIEAAKTKLALNNKRTIFFIDEIHRFNKAQQDTLLPYVEDGTVILIGATTENPYFEVNKALISRSMVFELVKLTQSDIKKILLNALNDKDKGLGNLNINLTDEAFEFLADMCNGDARVALNSLELAALTTNCSNDGYINITLSVASCCIQKRALNYDKTGENHYDTTSAFIKSMRGSDPDAAIYYLAKMIYSGEDLDFIARRIVICAAEDVGNADPNALQIAMTAFEAAKFVGMPEARIILAEAVIYISCAPKSNSSIVSIDKALKDVSEIQIQTIPPYLKDCHLKSTYKYAHDYPNHYVKQQYLPDELVDRIYYEPSENGKEKKLKEFLNRLRN